MTSMQPAENVLGAAGGSEERLGHSLDGAKGGLEDRFDTIGWGLLLLLVGAAAMPNGTVQYVSVAAVGALMLGLNLARMVAGVPVRWFSIILGAAVLLAGVGAMAGLKIDAFALFFALLGLATIAGALVPSR